MRHHCAMNNSNDKTRPVNIIFLIFNLWHWTQLKYSIVGLFLWKAPVLEFIRFGIYFRFGQPADVYGLRQDQIIVRLRQAFEVGCGSLSPTPSPSMSGDRHQCHLLQRTNCLFVIQLICGWVRDMHASEWALLIANCSQLRLVNGFELRKNKRNGVMKFLSCEIRIYYFFNSPYGAKLQTE